MRMMKILSGLVRKIEPGDERSALEEAARPAAVVSPALRVVWR